MKSYTKRLLSLVVVVAMALSLLPMISFAADAPTTLYVQPNSNWLQGNARFAAYFFETGKPETWINCTDDDGDGVYQVDVPAGYTNVIFCRMNPGAAANTWSNKWNQTSDLKVADASNGKVCYVVAANTWDKGKGQWVEYTPEGGTGETEPPQPNAYAYYVAGVAGLCGNAWSECDDANGMSDEDADGIFTKTYAAVAAGTYQFKVTDGTWVNCWGGTAADGNYEFTLVADADVTINFNSTDKTITVISEGLEEQEPPQPNAYAYYVAGVAGLCGTEWVANDDANGMTDEDADGIFTKTYTAVAAGTYQFKVTDGTWNEGCNWGGTAAGGNYEFTLVADADVTISFNSTDKTITVISEGLEEEEPFVPGVREYCLVGYINGADYGIGDDSQNVGEYIFVDGTLTTSFTADSYIFVKTTDNAHWLMSTAYSQESSCTFVEGATEKLYVPCNVVLTFTLVENEDGSVTVSYVTGEASPDQPIPDPDPEPDPDPTPATYYVVGSFNGWTNPDDNYVMNANDDGTYSLSINVTAGKIELKVTNGTWDDGGSWGDNGNNVVANAVADGTILVTFDPKTGTVLVTGDCLGELPQLAIESLYVAGEAGLVGADWDPTAKPMTGDQGVYTLTFTGIAVGTYQFKVVANGTWDLNWATGLPMTSGVAETAWFNAQGNSSIEVTEDDSTVTVTFDTTSMNMVTGEGATLCVTVMGSEPAQGVTVSGKVTTGAEGDTTVELLNGETVVATATVSGKEGNYSFEDVAAGTYTLKVSKANHVTRTYTVTVAAADVTQDTKIHLIGDLDGNGIVNMGDVGRLYAHVRGTNELTDEYIRQCANVNGGILNMGDTGALYSHVRGTKLLY